MSEWSNSRTKWAIFNDANYCGVLVQAWDDNTGELLLKQGRLTAVSTHIDFIFDEYTIKDDGKQPPDHFAFSGIGKDVNGTPQMSVNLASSIFSRIYNSVWTQFGLTGTVNEQPFNGTCWSEHQNNRYEPTPPSGEIPY